MSFYKHNMTNMEVCHGRKNTI